jgi:spermidine synthase
VVLAAFFTGMAAGNALGERWSRHISPLLGYAIAEVAAAIWACLIPLGLNLLETSGLNPWLSSSAPVVQTMVRVGFTFVLLLPATTALGTTLPLIAEFVCPAGSGSRTRVVLAYGLNTTGAVTGVVLATALLLWVVGVTASSYLAAGVSVLCGLVAAVLSRSLSTVRAAAPWPAPEPLTAPLEFRAERQHSGWSWLVPAAIPGFTLLALEVLYTRMFSLVLHNSSYTFGAVVTVFLVSLALGAFVVARLERWLTAEQIVAGCAGLGALAVPVSVLLFLYLTRLEYFTFGESFTTYLAGVFGLVALVLLIPVGLLGMLLPAIWQAALRNATDSGASVGRVTAINTLAAATGSLAAALLLLPLLGLWGAFVLVAVPPALLALVCTGRHARIGTLIFGLVLGGLSVAALLIPAQVRLQLLAPGQQLREHWESPYGWVELVQSRGGKSVQLLQNLHYGLGTVGRKSTQPRQGHIPLLLHKQPEDVLFLGLGTGMTAGAAIPHAEVKHITVVELIPDVVRAARELADWNNDLVDSPRVEIRIDDARHFLLGTTAHYDVIISDLFVPWESQTGYLYTVDHYKAVQQRLRPGGLFCQWLPLYQLGPDQFELIANSFATVFPHTTLWWSQLSGKSAVLGLIGSDQPLEADGQLITARLEALRAEPGKATALPDSAEDLFFLHGGAWPQPDSTTLLNTDEHPRVEFLTPVAHRNAALLQTGILRAYFDRVLDHLPEGKVRLSAESQADDTILRKRRDWHRWMLFGSSAPESDK